MATITTRTRRSREDWDALAAELEPILRAGTRISSPAIAERIGSNGDALKEALARRGRDPQGNPLTLQPITGARESTIAKRVAAERAAKTPWWEIKARTGMSYAELNRILREHDYAPNGTKIASNGGS